METVAGNLQQTAATIKTWVADLLLRHSSIHHEPTRTWESTIVSSPIQAPTFTNDGGMTTTPGAR